jgi:hypothetical protein
MDWLSQTVRFEETLMFSPYDASEKEISCEC